MSVVDAPPAPSDQRVERIRNVGKPNQKKLPEIEHDEATAESSASPPVIEVTGDRSHEDEAVDTIRLQYTGLRVRLSKGPQARKVSAAKNAEAARAVGADPKSTTLMKRLWKADEPAIRAVNKVFGEINALVRDTHFTLPTSTDGLRLVRRSQLSTINTQLQEKKRQLANAAAILKIALPAIIEREFDRSPGLFDGEVYRSFDPVRDCQVDWDFPVVMEDKELGQLDQNVYQQEVQRVRNELRQCVRKCEEEMGEALFEALKHASTRLESNASGKKKTFKATTITKLFDSMELISTQLAENKIGGEQFRAVSEKLKAFLGSTDRELLPDTLRNNDSYRERFAKHCGEVAEHLLSTATPSQRRRLIRKSATED